MKRPAITKARTLRDEALARDYLSVKQVAKMRRVSETTIRKVIVLGLLPAVDMTPASKIQTLRIRSDDALTLDTRIKAYKRARRAGMEHAYLEKLAERFERREDEEVAAILAGVRG